MTGNWFKNIEINDILCAKVEHRTVSMGGKAKLK